MPLTEGNLLRGIAAGVIELTHYIRQAAPAAPLLWITRNRSRTEDRVSKLLPYGSKEFPLSASAAEKIVFDDAVCEAQVRGLASKASMLTGAVGSTSASLGSTAFGVMNSFLVGPTKGIAARTGELAGEASAMAARMSEGVRVARATLTAYGHKVMRPGGLPGGAWPGATIV